MHWVKGLIATFRSADGTVRPRYKFVVSLVTMAVLLVSGGVFSQVQSARAAEQYTKEQLANEFTADVDHEAALMHTYLKLALHESGPCKGECNRDEDFARIVDSLIMRCERFEPAAWQKSPYFDARRNGRPLGYIKSACSILQNAGAKHGKPVENAEWIREVAPARAVFQGK